MESKCRNKALCWECHKSGNCNDKNEIDMMMVKNRNQTKRLFDEIMEEANKHSDNND